MARFISQSRISNIVETEDLLYFDNYAHDLTSFAPIFLRIAPGLTSAGSTRSHFVDIMKLKRVSNEGRNQNWVVLRQFPHKAAGQRSIYEQNTEYFIVNYPARYGNFRIYRDRKDEFEGVESVITGTSPNNYPFAPAAFYENQNRIYWQAALGNPNNPYFTEGAGIIYLNKASSTVGAISTYIAYPYSRTYPIFLNTTTDDIYLVNCQGSIRTYFRVVKINLQNAAATLIATFQTSANISPGAPIPNISDPKEINPGQFEFYYVFYDTPTVLKIKRGILDVNNQTYVATDTTINNIPFPNGQNTIYAKEIIPFRFTNSQGTEYLVFFLIQGQYNNGGTNEYKGYVFRIDANNRDVLHYVSQIDLFDLGFIVSDIFPLDADNRIFFVYYQANNLMRLIRQNETTEQFDIIDERSENQDSICRDKLGRIWVRDGNTNTQRLEGFNIPYTVELRLQNQYYEWQGAPINTNLLLDAYNHLGQRVQATVEITLRGNAEYTDGTKVKTFTTSTNSTTQIPIVITGPGYVEAIPRIIL